MKSAKSISRFAIDYMVGNAVPYVVKIDTIQLVNPFKKLEDAIEYIHKVVDGVAIAEVVVYGLTTIPEESGFDDVMLGKMSHNVINFNVHITDNLMYLNYRGMPLQKKISKIQDAVEEVKKFSPKVKETGGEISIVVECGPVL